MRIWIDADGCPVRKLVLRIDEEFALEVIQVADRSHEFREGTAVLVDIGADSAEYYIISKARPGDLMITQDYGAAALALGKGLRVMDQNGREYTEANIDGLLFERALSDKIRRAGGRTAHMKKRRKEDDICFVEALRSLLQEISENGK